MPRTKRLTGLECPAGATARPPGPLTRSPSPFQLGENKIIWYSPFTHFHNIGRALEMAHSRILDSSDVVYIGKKSARGGRQWYWMAGPWHAGLRVLGTVS